MRFFQLDDWVLCRIYKKKSANKNNLDQKLGDDYPRHPQVLLDNQIGTTNESNEAQMLTSKPVFPRTSSLNHLLELDYWAPLSHLLCDGPPPSLSSHNADHEHQTAMGGGGGTDQRLRTKLEVTNRDAGSVLNQFPAFSGLPAFEFH